METSNTPHLRFSRRDSIILSRFFAFVNRLPRIANRRTFDSEAANLAALVFLDAVLFYGPFTRRLLVLIFHPQAKSQIKFEVLTVSAFFTSLV